ncbi:hypothetical protein RS030_7941 [Cryptosporidium xiaoi]|uniref:Uncharacterized protein n=1 Tax=Cryptosporidium xiaoi TaxID=659607 RepID=A0AAV9XTD3_9CRYT
MDFKNKLKTAKKKITGVLIKLAEDEEILRQTAIADVGILLRENKECDALEDVKNILIEILMNIIIYSSVNQQIKDLSKFISDIPEISNLSDYIRSQSMDVLLESKCYSVIDIFRRLLGSTIQNSKTATCKFIIPVTVFRPLIGEIVSSYSNDRQLLLEVVNFLYLSTHCISVCVEKCLKLNKYDLLNEILSKLLPIVDNNTKVKVFASININLLKYNLEIDSNGSCQNDKIQCLILLLLMNTNYDYSLLSTLVPIISQLKIKEKFCTLLCLFILLTLVKVFGGSEFISKLSNSIELLNILKFVLRDGGITELKHEKIFNIVNLIVITMSILLLKTTNVDEFDLISEIIEDIVSEFEQVNTLPFISSLIYHIKGDLVKDNSLCSKSKCILFKMLNVNKLEDLSNIKINVHELLTVSADKTDGEINNFLEKHNFLTLIEENTLSLLKSYIYNSLHLGLRFVQLQTNIESRSFDISINDEIYYFVVGCTIIKYYLGTPFYSDKLSNLLRKIVTNECNHQIKLFDYIFPAYEFLLRSFENDKDYIDLLDSICNSLVSFGNNKNILPVVYNRMKRITDGKILRKLYLLFTKGELSFSKLEDELINQINLELSESNTELHYNKAIGFRTLFCILRFKPDIINEIFIEKLQQGLKSINKHVVSASLHCLIELCKFEIFDCDKTIKILLGLYSNALITEIRLSDNITPLVEVKNQNFGFNYKHFPIQVLSSFLRLFNVYLCENWPSEKNSFKKVPNNVFYILTLIIQIIRDNKGPISMYSLNIISNLFREYFYKNNKLDEKLQDFIICCIDNCFDSEINNLFHLLELIDSFISMNNLDLEINNLNFITENLSGPVKTILNFELKQEIYNSKKYNGINHSSSLFSISIKNQFNYDNKSAAVLINESNIDESRNIIKGKLSSLKKKVTHNYCIQEIINFLLYDVKQLRIEVIKDLNEIEIDLFRLRFLKDIFKIIKNIKLLVSTTFQWQMMFQFVSIFREYFNQLNFITLELIPRSKSKTIIFNIEDEIFMLFYFFLSYLPSFKNLETIFENHLDILGKVFEIRGKEKQLFDELFIDNQSILIIMLSGLVVLRYDLLSDIYEKYISKVFNIEVFPNKLFNSFVNCEAFIKRYFSKKTVLIDQLTDQKQETKDSFGSYIVFCDHTYYLNKEISAIEFICILLRYTYQHSKGDYEQTLKKYFILQTQEQSIKISLKEDGHNSTELFLFSNENLINNYCFGLFSFFDIIFDNFSEKDEILNQVMYYYNLTRNNKEVNVINLIFQTVCSVKLFECDILNISQLFLFVNENFLMKNDYFEDKNNDKNLGILIKAFCFSYIYYSINKSADSKNSLRSDQLSKLNEHSSIIMNIVKYYILTKFFENIHNNETQYYIISSMLLIRGYYWVPWSTFLNKNQFVNIDTLNELCGIINKNQINSVKKEVCKSINDNYSNIDTFMANCINDPIKISISALFLFSQTNNLSNSLENRSSYHNRDNYFEMKILNRNSMLFAIIYKLDIATRNAISIISSNYFENETYNCTLINKLVFIGVILNSLVSSNVCDNFTNFNISETLESLLFKIAIPLLKSREFQTINSRFVEWFILRLTNFVSSYLISNNSFSSKIIYFGNYMIDYFIKNSQDNKIIMLSFTRLIGIIISAFDSDIYLLKNFTLNFFNKLLKFRDFEMYVLSGLINIIEIFKINVEKRRNSLVIKISNVVIDLLSEITFNSKIISNKIICKSLELLVTLLYDHFSQISSDKLENFVSSINPLIFSGLILDNKVSVDIVHDYYLNMSLEPTIHEVISLVIIYKLCIRQSVSYENQILNFLYFDLINSVKASKKQMLTITLLLSFLMIDDIEETLMNNPFVDNLKYCSSELENKKNNWDDIRNFFFLDKVNDPIVESWQKMFINDDGITFLSDNYHSIKEFPQVSIDTNYYYGKEFLSWSLHEYPEVFLGRIHNKNTKNNWRELVSSLFHNPIHVVNSSESTTCELRTEQITRISYILLVRVESDIRTTYSQYKNALIKIIKELEKQ